MKYVIKGAGYSRSYAEITPEFLANPAYGFNYTEILSEATSFVSITDAIDAIQLRAGKAIGGLHRFTIVGIEPVIKQPEYREVAL